MNLEQERTLRLSAQLFQKMLIFNSKIEEMKDQIYERNPDFDVLGVFELYDEEFKGHLTTKQFTRFLEEFEVYLDQSTISQFLLYLSLHKNPPDEKLSFLQFIHFLSPSQKDQGDFLQKLYLRKRITESGIHLSINPWEFSQIRDIILMTLKKVQEYTILLIQLG